jgi:hypothetical protein
VSPRAFDRSRRVDYLDHPMKRAATWLVWTCVLLLAACAAKTPPPDPMSLAIPPPPEARPGSIRVYGDHLPSERAEEIRVRLRAAEPALFTAYRAHVADSPADEGEEGRLQLRIGINRDGKVTEIDKVYSETSDGLDAKLRPVLERIRFGPGPEAWVYYTLAFQPDPLEVLHISTDFAEPVPAIVALVENRSTFHFRTVSATVTVLGPQASKPLRVYRRRLSGDFPPRERRDLRIPLGGEWATARNSFLVTVRPVRAGTTESTGGTTEGNEPGTTE